MSLRKKCQSVWLRAATGQDITLQFSCPGDMERGRLALYDATRRTQDKALMEAREVCEVRRDKASCTVTVSRKDKNPFYDAFKDLPLEGEQEPEAGEVDPIEASLRAFEEKMMQEGMRELERGEGPRPGTPYFSRD